MSGRYKRIRAVKDANLTIGEIIYVEADVNHTTVHLDSGKKLLLAKTLKQLYPVLSNDNFIRPSKSHVVNINYLKSVTCTHLILTNNEEVEISRSRRPSILKMANSSGFGGKLISVLEN